MKNFTLIRKGVDVTSLLAEIDQRPEVWFEQTGRREIRVQAAALAIPIRGLRKSKIRGRKRRDVHESRYTTISRSFQNVRRFIEEFAMEIDAKLGRAKIVNLPPGKRVLAHRDRGEYYACRDRYHLVLDSEGAWMRAGDEEVSMCSGELWWFDNKAVHDAWNPSEHRRIHLIFDLEPKVMSIPASACRVANR
jgi:hypothetical protein